jgi:hypothetical protein
MNKRLSIEKQLSVDMEYKNQLEDNFLRHIGYEYTNQLCEELDAAKEQWQDIQLPEGLDSWIRIFAKKENKRRSSRGSRAIRILKSAAIFLFLFIGINYFLIVNVEAYRTRVMKAIVDIQYSFMNIDYVLNDGDISYPQPDIWENLYYLSYLPKGYTMTESNHTNGNVAYIIYQNEDGNQIAFQQFFSQTNMQIDTENAKVTNVSVNGAEAILVEKEDFKIMTWLLEDRAIYLETHNLSNNEVIKMAKNMKLSEK